MRVPKFSFPVIIVGFALTFLLASSLSAKERGWYVHGGLSYWNDMHGWESESYFVKNLPGFSSTGWRRDGSASQTSSGVGYNINKNWAIEVFSRGLPDVSIPGRHWLIPPIEPDDEPVSASWAVTRQNGSFSGVSVIYDYYLSERISLFLKVGGGWSGSDHRKLENTLTGSHRVLLDEQIPFKGMGRTVGSSSTSVYAVGMRMPLRHYTKVSITFEYQFVKKRLQLDVERDETLPPPNNLIHHYATRRASTFEIGIELHM